MKLADLARLARADLSGSGEVEIRAITDLAHAHHEAIVLVADPRRLPAADASTAGALLVGTASPPVRKPALRAANVRAAFARVLGAFAPAPRAGEGIHPTAVVAPDVRVGPDVTIGPLVVVEAGAALGDRTTLLAGVTIGPRARIGADSLLHSNVTIYPDTIIGDRVIIHGGAVIGSDGFGYAAEDGVHLKIPHLGRVVIEDDVEIGANVTVDRGTLGETRIGRGTKIDNLVQVAHNVTIGEGVIIIAQVGISGSVTIGPGALLAGQAGVADHRTIGAGARVLGRAVIARDVPAGATVSGAYARDHYQELRLQAALRRVPELIERVEALEAKATTRAPRRARPRSEK
ncbi:MAG: UDP-3-O-(3-hydroxymyristoyl)glucosamine N-acyltransferase [Armatimonadota bacterium]